MRDKRYDFCVGASCCSSFLNFEYLDSIGACIVGDPERCIETARRYKAADCDLLLSLVTC